jgi:hypothetical protein
VKAKDYAKKYEVNRTAKGLADIIAAFVQEGVELQEARKAYSAAAQYAILNEQDQKWRAFARLVGGVKEDGFEMIVRDHAPEHYEGWRRYNRRGRPETQNTPDGAE